MNEIYGKYISILTDILNHDNLDNYTRNNRINTIRETINDEMLYDYDELIISTLYADDISHIESEKKTNTYYIGNVYKNRLIKDDPILIHTSISPRFLLKYKFETIVFFLEHIMYMDSAYNCLINFENDESIEIFKTAHDYIETGSIILKTGWLKIIQKEWKKIYKKRLDWKKKSIQPLALRYRQVHGRNMYGPAPTINGMLSYLQK